MPRENELHNSRLTNLIHYGTVGSRMLHDISESTDVPYFKAIAGMSSLILDTVEQVKTNKDEAVRLTTAAFGIIYALINACHDTNAELAPGVIGAVGQFFETLQRILTYLRNHLGSNIVKRVIRRMEDSALIAECNAGLHHAQDLFGIQTALITNASMAEAERAASARHQELIDAFAKSSIYGSSSQTASMISSSSVTSLLPACPKIFYGRESELQDIVTNLVTKPPAHIAILGPGGIGKSSLALAALHHEQIVDKFPDRYFVPCDSAHSPADLLSLIATYFGLEGKSTKAILKYLTKLPGQAVLVLDNIETCWEPQGSRLAVEEFLSQLANVKHLALILTMRGAERPSKVQWSRPFLPVLSTLSSSAARDTFRDIADDCLERDDEVDELLAYTDNLPLAVTLMASLVSLEGGDSVIERWKAQGTSILSDGADRRNNLNKSIAMSLSSPRFRSTPEAQDLLALLAMLPDGMSITTLNQITSFNPNMLKCMTTLRRTALVYFSDNGQHVNTLVPIREYMRTHSEPPTLLLERTRDHFYDLLNIFSDVEEPPPGGSFRPIISNLGNIRSILQHFTQQPGPHMKDVVRAIIQSSNFTYYSGYGTLDLLLSIDELAKGLGDPRLYGEYLTTVAKSHDEEIDVDALMLESIRCFESVQDLSAQAKSHTHLSQHCMRCGEMSRAMEHAQIALQLATAAGDVRAQAAAMLKISAVEYRLGTVKLALEHANEARDLAREGADVLHEIMSIRQEVYYLVARGDYRRAAPAIKEGVVLVHALGLDSSSYFYRSIIILQGEVYFARTEYDDARKVNEALANSAHNARGDPRGIKGYALHNLALADIFSGSRDIPGILRNLDAARRIFLDISDLYGIDMCNTARMELHFLHGEYEAAKIIARETVAPAGKSGDILAFCWETLGDMAYAEKDFTAAFRCYIVLFATSQKHEDMRNTTMALRRIGDIFRIDGDVDAALHVWKIALDAFTGMDVHRGRAECMLRIGDVYMERGDATNPPAEDAPCVSSAGVRDYRRMAGIDNECMHGRFNYRVRACVRNIRTFQERGDYESWKLLEIVEVRGAAPVPHREEGILWALERHALGRSRRRQCLARGYPKRPKPRSTGRKTIGFRGNAGGLEQERATETIRRREVSKFAASARNVESADLQFHGGMGPGRVGPFSCRSSAGYLWICADTFAISVMPPSPPRNETENLDQRDGVDKATALQWNETAATV
ncbi:hypothetical protein FB451DRAFT_1361532 [Mycena latifolia]|nr:hypothetical protein FB451DRAFT_1361532 [Mycena latifolia]